MRKITLADRLRYRFDNTVSRGTVALIGWLFLLIVGMVLTSSLLVYATGIAPKVEGHRPGFLQTIWLNLMRTIDTGNVGGDRGSWLFLMFMLLVTVGGILVFSTLIGIISRGIDGKLIELRKGRSFVVEKDHTIIFGWSPQIFSIIAELIAANESRASSCIAVLAEKDKVEMEDEIRTKIGNNKNTRIVCRTGDPTDIDDLEIINPYDARSIIVLSPENEEADSQVIKTILALTNDPERRKRPYHIVSRIREPENLSVAWMVGDSEVELVSVDDLIARITAQTCYQSGLSAVYADLLNFQGSEIYFTHEPSLDGKTFHEVLTTFENSAVIGLRTKDGYILLNPLMDTKIFSGDAVILIAEDDSTISISQNLSPDIDNSKIRAVQTSEQKPERTLILGWNHRASTIINKLDSYTPPGSEVTVVANDDAMLPAVFDGLSHQVVTLHVSNTTDRRTLDDLNVPSYDHVIVLSYSDRLDYREADSRTLITLLHLREIADQNNHSFSIVSEMLDVRNRELAEVTRADDFIVSDWLVSLLMCQISENKELSAVFDELFDPQDSELYLKPARDYVDTDVPLNFYTVVEAACQRGEIAIGYRAMAKAGDPHRSYGVHLNPNKSHQIVFAEKDQIIVLAES